MINRLLICVSATERLPMVNGAHQLELQCASRRRPGCPSCLLASNLLRGSRISQAAARQRRRPAEPMAVWQWCRGAVAPTIRSSDGGNYVPTSSQQKPRRRSHWLQSSDRSPAGESRGRGGSGLAYYLPILLQPGGATGCCSGCTVSLYNIARPTSSG